MPIFPQPFTERIQRQLAGDAEAFFKAFTTEAPVSIRFNPSKKNTAQGTVVPWCPQGRYLKDRPVFTLDPLFHAGCYYVQEAASMFLEEIFTQLKLNEQPLLVLD